MKYEVNFDQAKQALGTGVRPKFFDTLIFFVLVSRTLFMSSFQVSFNSETSIYYFSCLVCFVGSEKPFSKYSSIVLTVVFSFSIYSSAMIFFTLLNFLSGGSSLFGLEIIAADQVFFIGSLGLSDSPSIKSSTVQILTVSIFSNVETSFTFSTRRASGETVFTISTFGYPATALGGSVQEIELPMIWNNIKIIIKQRKQPILLNIKLYFQKMIVAIISPQPAEQCNQIQLMSFDFRKMYTKLFGQFHLQVLFSLIWTFIFKVQPCSINYISGMKKQKSEVLPVCKCNQFEQQITKIRRKTIETLNITTKVDSYSVYRLVKMLIYAFTERQKYIQFIDNQLRNETRKNPTIEYRQGMSIQEMINTLFNRISKEKIIHHYAVQKERQIINKYVKETRSAAEQIDYLKQLLIQQQREQQTWKNEAIKQEKINNSLKKQIQLKKEENRLLQDLLKKLELKINSLQVKIVGLEKDKSQLSRDYLLKSEQVAKLASNLQSFKSQLSYNSKVQLNQQIQAIMSERSIDCNPETTGISSLHKHNSSIVNEYHLYSHLFVGEVLLNQEQSKRFLIQTLQNHSKNAISRTKFIYKMDYYNTTNIHKYIDGIPHLVFLIRTDHGQLIAAYSQGSFKPKTISNRDGLLINLTHQKVYANTKKAIVYDQVQVIFGNFDLKFKIGQSKLFSNFGTTNSFYECKGETINSLLGQGKNRQAKLKTYEIFQLFYQL